MREIEVKARVADAVKLKEVILSNGVENHVVTPNASTTVVKLSEAVKQRESRT